MPMIPCPHCGFANDSARTLCKSCGKDVRLSLVAQSTEPLSPDARTALLTAEIQRQVTVGWQVVSQTPTTAQLTRKGQANGLVALILLLFFILPAILYVLLARPTETLFISVDEFGQITRTMGSSG